MNKMPDKKEIVEELMKLFNDDEIVFREVSFENETEELYGNPQRYIEVKPTGNKTITINLLNRKQHIEFVEKLRHKY
jgi:hypothetical protein